MKLESTHALIGSTPLLRIRCALEGRELCIYAKAEYYNLSGSIKDRMALRILEDAEAQGALRPGQPIVEMTSGNTGIAFAALGALTKHPVHIFMPDWASAERKALMKMYGAELHLVSREQGGFSAALTMAQDAAKELGAFEPRQFENQANPAAHYHGTGAELLRQLPGITDFVAGVGSGGTLMGTARRLKEDHSVRAAAVEPDAIPLLSGGSECGEHRIEGIGDSFIPPVVEQALIDSVWDINDMDAIAMSARLARELGLGVGISSGANFLGAVLQQQRFGGEGVATVFADDSKKYLSTLLSDAPAPRPGSLAERLELIGYESVR